MSNVGKIPIQIPPDVDIEVSSGKLRVKGPKGELERVLPKEISISKENSIIKLTKSSNLRKANELYGLFRTLIFNMVKGVTQGFEKKLKMVGVGFKAQVSDSKLVLNVGFSHPVELTVPNNIDIKVEKNTLISISGIDKELVGKTAASIRAVKEPEPYKGKGIMYEDEKIRRKAGKTLKAGPTS